MTRLRLPAGSREGAENTDCEVRLGWRYGLCHGDTSQVDGGVVFDVLCPRGRLILPLDDEALHSHGETNIHNVHKLQARHMSN